MSSSHAYLHPIMDSRPNLKIRTGCWVKRVVLDSRTSAHAASSTSTPTSSRHTTVGARREVIVSCGSIDTPKLLMLSGIGPADHLREFGIDVMVDSPGVGANLDDHVEGIVMWEAAKPMVKRSTQWWEIGLFTATEDGLDRPDLMMHYGSVPFDMNTVRWGYPTAESAFCLTPNVCRGRSRGTVRLRSPDFRDRARVDPRYFTDPDGHDERVMLAGVRLAQQDRLAAGARRVDRARAGARPGRHDRRRAHRLLPQDPQHRLPPGVHGADGRAGRPRGGASTRGLRVKGVRGLRIADGSIMPFLAGDQPVHHDDDDRREVRADDQGRRPRRGAAGGARVVSSTQTKAHSMFVDGEWGPAASGETVETTSPATGECSAPCRRATAATRSGRSTPPTGRSRAGRG